MYRLHHRSQSCRRSHWQINVIGRQFGRNRTCQTSEFCASRLTAEGIVVREQDASIICRKGVKIEKIERVANAISLFDKRLRRGQIWSI